ncbi:MAG: peptidylprolyl isomerase [Pseudomonadota bacterium]
MKTFFRSGAVLAGIVMFAAIAPASAQTVASINGVDISRNVFDFYSEERAQKPLADVTQEERDFILDELIGIYALSTQPRASELSEDPTFQAKVEIQFRAALAQAVASDWLRSNPATEEEIQVVYAEQSKLAPPLQFKARHILVETQAAAIDLISQLDGGASFEELAATHSTGPSGANGGDLGWFAPNQMVPPFSAAVAALEDGAYSSEPVQTEFGWHVILREDSRENAPPPLENVRDTIKAQVEAAKFQSYLESIRQPAPAASDSP